MPPSSLSNLVNSINELSPLVQRKISALAGAIIGDSGSTPLTWIYDQDKLKQIVGESRSPVFWEKSECPYFTLAPGKHSAYSDEALVALNVIKTANNIEPKTLDEYSMELVQVFGASDSPYQIALKKRADKVYPVEGPWIPGSVIKFLENYQDKKLSPPGSDTNKDYDGYSIALPYAIKNENSDFSSELKPIVEILTTEPSMMPRSQIQFWILRAFINESTDDPIKKSVSQFKDQFPEIVKEVEDVIAAKDKDYNTAAKEFGIACSMPGSFQGALLGILRADSYENGISKNIMAGGDCCARSMFLGACLGAKFGINSIPLEWMEKADNFENILKNIVQVMK